VERAREREEAKEEAVATANTDRQKPAKLPEQEPLLSAPALKADRLLSRTG